MLTKGNMHALFQLRRSSPLSRLSHLAFLITSVSIFAFGVLAQVNSGSNGSDGALNPTTNLVINMADHPDGIYHYTSVNISNGVTVTFIPNANNTPVTWLVQLSCTVNGTIRLDGSDYTSSGGLGGPGGYRGGNGGIPTAGNGLGPGGGMAGAWGGNASFGTLGSTSGTNQALAGPIYGNNFLLPLIGGSGGGGSSYNSGGGGGGGGAILIAASQTLTMNGTISASGGRGFAYSTYTTPPLAGGGAGSGGAVRLVATTLYGTGSISVAGGGIQLGYSFCCNAGNGRVRLDAFENHFGGYINGPVTIGFQPIIIATAGQGAQLTVTSVGGVPVSASPTGALSTPDAILSAQQNNPIPVVVHCANIPMNTQITVSVKPANGTAVSATGFNNTGTLTSSTATVLINMPRGGGLIYATAAN